MADDARLQVVLEAKIDKLQATLSKANQQIAGFGQKAQRDLDKADSSWGKLFGKSDPGKALDRVFDNTRLKVFDTASARIGVTGAALEDLGPAGLIAAAGLGAVGGAFAQAAVAAKYADEIEDTAQRLHITTDALQQFRYAIVAAGGDTEGAEQAIEAFSVKVGQAEAGLKKAQRWFAALGISPEQLKSLDQAGTLLEVVTEKIAGLRPSQQDAAIEALGLDGLKPLVEGGVDAMRDFLNQASAAGAVIDEKLIHTGAEANRQFELLSKVIDTQLKSAFIDLAPVLAKLLNFAAEFAKEIAGAADQFRSIEKQSKETLANRASKLAAQAKDKFGNTVMDVSQGLPIGTTQKAVEQQFARVAFQYGQRVRDQFLNHPDTGSGRPTVTLPGTPKPAKKPPSDDNAVALDAAQRAELSAHAALLQALLAQTPITNDQTAQLQQIADIQAAQVDAERQTADDHAKKLLADKHITQATYDQVVAKNAQVATEKKQVIALDARQKIAEAAAKSEEAYFAYAKEIRSAYSEIASNQAAQATTSAERLAIELRDFDLNRDLDRRMLVAKLKRLTAEEAGADRITQSEADARLASFDDQTRSGRSAVAYNNPDMRESGRRDARGDADSIASGIVKTDDMAGRYGEMYAQIDRLRKDDLLSEEQAERAKGQIAARYTEERLSNLSAFFGTLAQLSTSSNKKLAAIGKAAAIAEATIDGIVAVQKALKAAPPPLNFALAAAVGAVAAVNVAHIAGVPGFAKGTDSAPGGVALVGENGPELVRLERGSQVIPNDILRNLSNLRVPQVVRQDSILNYHVHIDLTGANGDDTIRRIAYDAAEQGAVAGARGGAALAQQRAAYSARKRLS